MNKLDHRQETMVLFERKKRCTNKGEIISLRNQIVNTNLPLVTTVLKKYRPYTDDQFQIGCMGLIKATDTYDLMKEVPFSSYACFIIERELHMEHRRKLDSVEEQMKDSLVFLDAKTFLANHDEVEVGSMIEDTEASKHLEEFIEDNELDFMCSTIIKPAIQEVRKSGERTSTKIDFNVWEELEFRYIMALTFEESQKNRFNLTQMAKECGVSLPNIRLRHTRVMESIFQRMWGYMNISFTELLTRLRGGKKIPETLLCLDPGKTTGYCVFKQGVLQEWSQLENCYDDKNIDAKGLTLLLNRINPDFIVYEDYKVYSHKLDSHSYNPVMTVRLLGVIETYCQVNDVLTHKQMAVTAKNFCTDDKLKQWGFWQKGMRHARDAIRHGCYFLLFHKRGQDLV